MIDSIFRWLVLAITAGALLLVLDRLGLWMEARGWIYYRRRKPSTSSLGNAFLEIQTLLEPGKRHVVEARLEEQEEREESGDPPQPGLKEPPRREDSG